MFERIAAVDAFGYEDRRRSRSRKSIRVKMCPGICLKRRSCFMKKSCKASLVKTSDTPSADVGEVSNNVLR